MVQDAAVLDVYLPVIDEVLLRYSSKRDALPHLVSNSVQNINFQVNTDRGRYFVRFHSEKTSVARILQEHRVQAWLQARQFPICGPLPSREHVYLHEMGPHWVSVFPWISGRTFTRGSISPAEAHILGEMHGRLHAALKAYEDPELRSDGTGSVWNTEESLGVLVRLEQMVRKESLPTAQATLLTQIIRYQIEVLHSAVARPSQDFSSLVRQPVHGDYHEGNVMLDGQNRVVAVIDWEMVGRLPPIFELLRTLSYAGLLQPELLVAYVSGYRRWALLGIEECEQGVEMWFQSLLHDTWALRCRLLDGDQRVQRFFPFVQQRLIQFSDPRYRAELAQLLGNVGAS